jgi:hypothetical protein
VKSAGRDDGFRPGISARTGGVVRQNADMAESGGAREHHGDEGRTRADEPDLEGVR